MKLHYRDEGNGPVVLLIHAFPLNRTMWAPQVAALTPKFRVLTPDVRGFGESPSTPTSPLWTLEDIVDDVAELLDSLQIQDCVMAGLSMGGYIALPFYARYRERVRQLVLADTRARADNDAEKAARTKMIGDLAQSGSAILAERMLTRLLHSRSSAAVVQEVRRIIETTSASAAIAALTAMRDRPDASTILHRISCPTLVIAGEHDVITRVEECREMAQTISNGKFVSIANAGHLSNLENPLAFNQALEGFLTQSG